jgi:outer membrane biosynthesis protein TonB
VLAASVTSLWMGALPAAADTTDGTLTVVVSLDVNTNGDYDPDTDQPQAGIAITVTDAGGHSVSGTTDDAGQVVVEPTEDLVGGRYFVTAEIPDDLQLVPVPESDTFSPLSSTVDVTSESQTVHLGVQAQPEPEPDPEPEPEPESPTPEPKPEPEPSSPPAEPEPEPQPEPKPEPTPAPAAPQPPRFAVGDKVWRDLNRDGRQDPDEPPGRNTSVQLLDRDGTVVRSTTTDREGRYRFDKLAAGVYSLRFAGLPEESKLSPAGVGNGAADSDPDYTGVTPPFDLDLGEPDVRPAGAADGVRADYVNDSLDAGIASLTYAIGSAVWQDLDRDGLLDPDEPPGQAQVSLLDDGGQEIASTPTDDQGRYLFARLTAGRYRLRFTDLGAHRQLTTADVGGNPAVSSAADPREQTTEKFLLDQTAPDLVPADDFGQVEADFVKAALNVGTVGSYRIGNRVWRDTNGDGLVSPGEPGVGGIRVELLDAKNSVVAATVTGRSGRYAFDRLSAGEYKLRFSHVPKGLFFTTPGAGTDRSADSDVFGDAVTAAVTLSDDHPVEAGVAAGLSTSPAGSAGTTAPSSPGGVGSPTVAPTALSGEEGIAGGLGSVLASIAIGLLLLGSAVLGALRLRRRP